MKKRLNKIEEVELIQKKKSKKKKNRLKNNDTTYGKPDKRGYHPKFGWRTNGGWGDEN